MWMRAKRVLLPAACLLALGGCNNGNAVQGDTPAATTAATASYVLVTQARPESPEKYLGIQRASYDLCAQSLRANHLAAKPFPAAPEKLINARTTYASDGKRVVVREVLYKLDFYKGQVQGACEMRWSTLSNVAVLSGGQEQTAETDESGKVQRNPPSPAPAEPVSPSLLASYSLPKTINGVRLKCQADGSCIVDPAVVLVAWRKTPTEAASRSDPIPPFNTPIIVEPVSLTVGKPVDPALFALEEKK